MWQSLPEFGTAVLYAILVAAGYTFAVAVAAGAGRPRLLHAARLGAYGTIAIVGLAVLTLAFAFVSHDFRISYVARYSDRAMSVPYLIAALWGGQDGSLLWWLFLTSVFTGACVAWLKRKYLELQPYVIATLMVYILFLGILMVFAVNPFATQIGGAPVDGAGLNFQLRNFYMIIHPPSLYIGFTSAAIPFAFAIAALITGRLDSEWIVATRKWMMFSWLFLSIGNALGMLWAYEELGWGGYWAWDPVENAACLPWFTATAYVHATMIQERRSMLKVWNVFLICATFWLTIFGTFLTRSGLIASVHSFAQSGIGIYFVYFMGFVAATSLALIVWRLPRLRSEGTLESTLSRETAFVINNWGLLAICTFIAVATIWPRISEWLLDQKSTVGPPFYNFWIPPVAILIFALMGLAPLLGWRKTSPELFKKSFFWPVIAMVTMGTLHLVWHYVLEANGIVPARMRFNPFVEVTNLYPIPSEEYLRTLSALSRAGAHFVHYVGAVVAWINGKLPWITMLLGAFNVAVVVQEFARGVKARQRAVEKRNLQDPKQATSEHILASLFLLVAKSRRRYGGYIVHVGIVLLFAGFAGRAWGTDLEATMSPGDVMRIDADYEVRYLGTRRETDLEKMMIFADVEVIRRGEVTGKLAPAKFVYKAMGGSPSSEIDRHVTLRDDLYVTLAMANPQTKAAAFQFHVNPLVSFIWVGVGILILGALISLWPDIQENEVRAFSYVRAAASVAGAVMFSIMLALAPSLAYGPPAGSRAPPTADAQGAPLGFSDTPATPP